ncbi:MAG: hypothetical protein IPI97_14220 [Nitrosomonas sp.]|nr:hypothetical protein [Nitrosomonas sp.]
MLTTTQYQTLKTYILNDNVLNAFPNNEDGDYEIMLILNAPASPVFNVWNTETSSTSIVDAVDFSKYTPNDSVPTDTQLNVEIWKARAQSSTIKRDNIWAILDVTNGIINASKANVRAGLRDAVIGVPTGAAGAPTAPGGASGVNVLNACVRSARLIEKVLTTGSATTGTVTADIMGYVGEIQRQDVEISRRFTA